MRVRGPMKEMRIGCYRILQRDMCVVLLANVSQQALEQLSVCKASLNNEYTAHTLLLRAISDRG
jgi:hypothetical protein